MLSPSHVRMHVWERGAGRTLACGTGACATVVAGVLEGKTERSCQVRCVCAVNVCARGCGGGVGGVVGVSEWGLGDWGMFPAQEARGLLLAAGHPSVSALLGRQRQLGWQDSAARVRV